MTAGLVRGDGVFPPAAYERDDESPDDRFYTVPRKVVHIDDGAIGALGRLYAEMLPARGRLLDLMSSWRSHVPSGHAATIVGLGLNAEEMADNPQLASHVVHDLNRDPRLPFDDASFDGAMCAVSIQYVLHPAHAFRTVRRATLNVLPSRVCSHRGVAFAPTRPGTALALAYDSRASRGPRWQVVHRRHTRRHPRRVRHGEPARASLLPAPRLRQAVARRPPREPLPGHAVDGRLHRARGARDRRDGLADRRLRARPALRLAVGGEPGGRARGRAACGRGLGAGGERGLARPQPRDAA